MASWSDVLKSKPGTVWTMASDRSLRIIRLQSAYGAEKVAAHWNGSTLCLVGDKWGYAYSNFEETDETVTLVPTFQYPDPKKKFEKHELVEGLVYQNFHGLRFSRVGEILYVKDGDRPVRRQEVADTQDGPLFTLVPDAKFTLKTEGVFS